MKKYLIAFLLMIPVIGHCQTSEEKYYLYHVVSFDGSLTDKNIEVYYVNGIEVKKLRNDKGEIARFSTPAGVLMCFISQGWEMYRNSATTEGYTSNGSGRASTNSYWILRKSCTKEDFEKAVENAKKK